MNLVYDYNEIRKAFQKEVLFWNSISSGIFRLLQNTNR